MSLLGTSRGQENGLKYPSGLILLRRPTTDSLEHAKPVFEMPGVTHAPISQVVKFVHPYLYLLSRCGYTEDLAKMSSKQTRTNTSATSRANDLVYLDPEIWKGSKEDRHQLLEAFDSRLLSRS
jgi:hypothetical protein